MDDVTNPSFWDEETRKATFQALYAKEMARQEQLLKLESEAATFSSPPKGAFVSKDDSSEERSIAWEDG
jgi:hypothetical protein